MTRVKPARMKFIRLLNFFLSLGTLLEQTKYTTLSRGCNQYITLKNEKRCRRLEDFFEVYFF